MKTKFCISFVWLGLLLGINQLIAQDALITYQGLVMDNGTNFSGTGQFQFALLAGINFNLQATATANLSGQAGAQFVTSYTIISGGRGYVYAPTVTVLGGGGSGATAIANITGGVVTSITAVNAGSGYSSAPTVTLSPPPANLTYTSVWSNDGTSSGGSEPTAAVSFPVSNGLFAVVLGDTTLPNMTPIPASLFTQQNLVLRIWFNDGVNGPAELNPVQSLTPTPYALSALNASNLLGTLPVAQLSGVVSNAQLANTSVTINAGTGLAGGGLVALGGSTTLTNAGVLSVIGNADITVSASTNYGEVTLASTATNVDTANTIVKRDGNGNFSAGTITLAGGLNMINAAGNTAVGSGALGSNTAGIDNTANGWEALSANTTGSNNTANGWEALYSNTTGIENTAEGYLALFSNTTGDQNTACGGYALYYNNAGADNTASGWVALLNNTSGSNNAAGGAFALFDNQGGGYNTANGFSALYYNVGGSSNTANGAYALYQNTTGVANTASGVSALSANNMGNYNTADGYGALFANSSGNNNIAVGYGAGSNLTVGNYNIDIGSVGSAGDGSTIRIGSGQTTTYIAGIAGETVSIGAPVYVSSAGQLGIMTSSERFKRDIQSMGEASASILSLRPVTFRYKPELDAKGTPQFGLIAEEVSKVNPELVVRDDKNQIYTVRYEAVNAMLLNEFLKQHRKVEEQQAELQALKEKVAQVESLEKRLKALEQLVLPHSEGNSGTLQVSAR
jgi:trimeric autotransporter adhesin